MFAICKKELRQILGSFTGYIAIIVFLLLCSLFLFVFPETNVFDAGYATLDQFFELAPWILLLLIPAITMRSFSEEFKTGTWEILATRPISRWQIILGKYFSSLLIVAVAILPTLVYVITIHRLSTDGIDSGGIAGSYIGLMLLAASFTAIGLCCSAFTPNAVISFLVSAFACFLLYIAFNAISKAGALQGGADYIVEMIGIDFHYRSISRGVVDSRDIVYFISVIALFLFITHKKLLTR